MKGRYPVCCLFLEIDPAAVDVNIHPAKREVKFHQEAQIRRLVAQAVRETLLKFHTGMMRKTRVASADISVKRPHASEPIPETPELPQFIPAAASGPARNYRQPRQIPAWPAKPSVRASPSNSRNQ